MVLSKEPSSISVTAVWQRKLKINVKFYWPFLKFYAFLNTFYISANSTPGLHIALQIIGQQLSYSHYVISFLPFLFKLTNTKAATTNRFQSDKAGMLEIQKCMKARAVIYSS